MNTLVYKLSKQIKSIILLYFFIGLYLIAVLITLSWGLPNTNHPFPYHMDEWHQLMAIKAIVKEGTTTIAGAAQIPFFYPVVSGIYLLPFIAFHIVDPFAVKGPLDNLMMQQVLFQVLRSINIFFGIGCILLIAFIARNYFKVNYILPIFFFTLSPIFIMLSGYFKYDVALLFLIILSIAQIYRYAQKPTLLNYFIAAIISAIALATKFSSLPLLLLLIIAFFWFVPRKQRQLRVLFVGLTAFILTFCIVGIPNAFLGKADFSELLYSNLITTPQSTSNFTLSAPWWLYLPLFQYPLLFGHGFYWLSIVACIYLFIKYATQSRWKLKSNKYIVFLLLTLLFFAVSLIPLKIWATGNRVIVLLPFLSLILSIFIKEIFMQHNYVYKKLLLIVLIIVSLTHVYESTAWIYTKLASDPQRLSSEWIKENIPLGSSIGIENIPIYQFLPNIVVKEFYENQYGIKKQYMYTYEILDAKTKKLPEYIIITNDDIETKIMKSSTKEDIINHLDNNGYIKWRNFTPDLMYYNYIGTDETYYLSGLVATPLSIGIYKKDD